MLHTLNHSEFVFVFGSNTRGAHGRGAARTALNHFGAVAGQGEGLQGRSYGIPTKDDNLRTLTITEVRDAVVRFLEFAESEPETRFMVTRIGCGLAGFNDVDVAPLFETVPANVWLPRRWLQLLGAEDFRLLVSGATPMNDIDLFSERLDVWLAHKKDVPITLVCDEREKGPSALAQAYAERHNYDVAVWPADWKVFSRHAGLLRNHAMLWNSDASALFTSGDDTDSQIISKACYKDGVPLRQVVVPIPTKA